MSYCQEEKVIKHKKNAVHPSELPCLDFQKIILYIVEDISPYYYFLTCIDKYAMDRIMSTKWAHIYCS